MSDIRGPDEFAAQLMAAPRSVRVRAVKERLHRRKWQQFMKRPWLPPSTLPAAIGKFETEYPAVVRLSAAVDLMAFGIDSFPADPTEQGARCRQASRELCRGARDAKFKVMRGSPAVEVPPADFNPERGLGGAENSLVIDWTSSDATGEPWLNVQIETPRFLDWLRQRCNVPQIEKQSSQPAVQDVYVMGLHGSKGKLHRAVFDVMAEIWPNHLVPKNLSILAIEKKIAPGMSRRGFAGGGGDSNIRRILGLKK